MNRPRISVLTAASAGLALVLTGAPSQADNPDYVALGDSFSAGTGAGSPTHDDCYLSPHGYPHLVAASQGLALDYQACSGATTGDVLAHQVHTLDADTAYVTITIGGNDLGFASVIQDCLLPSWLGDCFGQIDQGRAILYGELPARYDEVFGTIAAAAPHADVRVGGYPHLFNGQDCHALTFFSAAEMAELNAATDELNAVTAQHTAAAGFTWVDPTDHFQGHAVCDADPWINNLSLRIVDSFHPNQAGNVAYAEVFWPGSTTGSTTTAPEHTGATEAVPTETAPSAVRTEADLVLQLELTSPEHLAQAEAAGIDPQLIIDLEADLRSTDPAVVEAALAELAALDAEHAEQVGDVRR